MTAWIRLRLRVHAVASGARVRARLARGLRLRRTRLLVGRGSVTALEVGSGVRGREGAIHLTGGALVLGRGADLGLGGILETGGGTVEVGPRARLGAGVVVRGSGGAVALGSGVRLGHRVVVVGGPGAPIRVGEDAVVGAGCTLLAGADVEAGALVPPGTVLGQEGAITRV